jgi:hypothetical protein
MTIHVVVLAGQFTQDMNGTPVTAERLKLVKAYHFKDKAIAYVRSAPQIEPGWCPAAMWVESVEVE